MILNEICNLPMKQKAEIGLKIAAKYRAMEKKKPEVVETKEGRFTFRVNDYPESWLKTHGQKVIDNYLKVRVK